MLTFAVATVKNEIDVIDGFIRHTLGEVDSMIVLDNGSTDGTRDVLGDLARDLPVTIIDDPELGYYQSTRMTRLASMAHDRGATWILPVDADELWVAEHRIGDWLQDCPFLVVTATLWNHFRTAIDTADPDPFASMQWRQADPGALPKVAFQWRPGTVVHQGNHSVTVPGSAVSGSGLEVRHFPYRSPAQFVAKAVQGAAAYAAAPDLPEGMGGHWRSYGRIVDQHGPEALEGVFREHFWYLSPVDSGMVYDPAPYRRWEP